MLENINQMMNDGRFDRYCDMFGANADSVQAIINRVIVNPLKKENLESAKARIQKTTRAATPDVDIVRGLFLGEIAKPIESADNEADRAALAFLVVLASENNMNLFNIRSSFTELEAIDNWRDIERAIGYGVSVDFNEIPEYLKLDAVLIALQGLTPEDVYDRIFTDTNVMEFVKSKPLLVNQLFESVNKAPGEFIKEGRDFIDLITLANENKGATLDFLNNDKFRTAQALLQAYGAATDIEKDILKEFYNTHICQSETVNTKFKSAVTELDKHFARYENLLEDTWNNNVAHSYDVKLKLLEGIDFDSMLALSHIDKKINGDKNKDFLDNLIDSFWNWIASIIGSDKKVFDNFKSNVVGPLTEALGTDTLQTVAEECGFPKLETERLVEKLANVRESKGREL